MLSNLEGHANRLEVRRDAVGLADGHGGQEDEEGEPARDERHHEDAHLHEDSALANPTGEEANNRYQRRVQKS